ncbi:MAG: glycosyltransferase family A protein, partial [Acidilobus sp.]
MSSSAALISVIVTAYNRRHYLPHALRSLKGQTLPRDRFKVIVVKNFEDKESDGIIRRNGWKNIVTDVVPLGGKIAIGLEEAGGEVVTFLEDDDMYRKERLSYIYRVFASSRDVVYF